MINLRPARPDAFCMNSKRLKIPLLLAAAVTIGGCRPQRVVVQGATDSQKSEETGLALAPVAGTLTFVTGNGYAPFSDESLPGGGIATTHVDAIFARAGLAHTIKFLPWSRAERLVEGGHFAGAFPYTKTPERERHFLYSDPVYKVKVRLFALSSAGIKVTQPSDLAGRTICRPLGYAWEADLKHLIDAGVVKTDAPPDMDSCLRMLKAGRVDAIIESEQVFWPTLDHLFPGERAAFAMLELSVAEHTLHFIVPKAHPRAAEILGVFNDGLRSVKNAP